MNKVFPFGSRVSTSTLSSNSFSKPDILSLRAHIMAAAAFSSALVSALDSASNSSKRRS